MKTTSRSTASALIAIAALGAGCTERAGAAAAKAPSALERGGAAAPSEGVQVRTVRAERVAYRGQIVANGDLKPDQIAQLGFAVPGTLVSIGVRRGQVVKRGDTLGALDGALARAQLAQAEAGLAVARSQAGVAKDALERLEKVRVSDGASDMQLVQAKAGLAIADAGVLAAEAMKAQAETNHRWQTLRAPFDGVITRVPDGPGITVGPGLPLFSLESTAALVLSTSVSAAEARALKVGGKVHVSSPTGGGSTEAATIRAIIPSIDPNTKRVPLEILVPNADGSFLANAFARARAEADAERPALAIPSSALLQREGSFVVFLASSGGARRVAVELLSQAGGKAIVDAAEGLTEESLVVDFPPPDLVEGARLAGVGAP